MASPYDETPFIVIWETTQACDLHCRHCRAAAIPMRNPQELSTEEAMRLIDDIAAMRPQPIFVLTGGDPMKRPDLLPLVRYAAERVRISITPSATPLVTDAAIRDLAAAGLRRWAFSIDGASAATHDAFRGQSGSFQRTLDGIRTLREIGLPLQVNTTVSRVNLSEMEQIGRLVEAQGAVLWSVFFLVAVGRGHLEEALDAHETEQVLRWLTEFSTTVRMDIKTTEAPHYGRVRREMGIAPRVHAEAGGIGRAPRPVSDGDGFIFISHKGQVFPSGFLPLPCGNVRERPLSEIYRTSPVLRELRDRSLLKGKCGYCEFREVCGGSRARAYAVTGDALESDPYCAHLPDPEFARQLRRQDRREALAGSS